MARLVEDTGQYANVTQPAQAAQFDPSPSFAEGSNLELFNRLPNHVKSMVNSLAEGRIPLAGRSPLSKDQMSQLFEVASAIDPTLDATTFNARNRTETAFSSGGPEGAKINSIRTAMAHLQNLERNYNKLDNFNIGGTWLNAPINYIERKLGNTRIQSGMAGAERNIKDLSGELASAFRTSGMAEADIKRELEGLNPNMATEDMRSTIENAVKDLEGKISEKVAGYNTTMHRNKTTADFLGPNAGAVYNRILTGGALNPPLETKPVAIQTPGQRMGEMTLEQQRALALARARVNAGIDPVGHPNMHMEQGDWLMNPPAKSPTGKPITDVLGDLWDASKLEGLVPEVSPIGGLTRLPSAEKGKVAVQGLVNAAKDSTVAQKLGDLLSGAGNAIGSIPKHLLAFESQRNPEAFNTLYQAYKQNIPAVKQAITEATPLGKELHSDMIYNYARQLGLSHEDAILAEDYTRNHPKGLGAWDIAMEKYNQFPNMPAALARKELASQVYKPFEQLSDAEKIKQATQASVDTATWSPIPARTGQNDLANVGMILAKKAIMPSIMHVTAPLSSPRIARMAAILAGKGANVAGKVGDVAGSAINMLPEASLEDLINAGLLDARTMRANQGEQ